MLVEFRVKNFRSLRDEKVLSLVDSSDKTLLDTHTVTTGLKAAPRLCNSIGGMKRYVEQVRFVT